MQIRQILGYFDPFSSQVSKAANKFSKIENKWRKAEVIAAAIFAALITLPLGGVGGIAVFRYLVERITAKPPAKKKEQSQKVDQFAQGKIKQGSNQENPVASKTSNPEIKGKNDQEHSPKVNPDTGKNDMTHGPDANHDKEEQLLGVPKTGKVNKEPAPDVSSDKKGLFVDIINAGRYVKDGVEIQLPPPSKPEKVVVDFATYGETIADLKKRIFHGVFSVVPTEISDLSTEEAIAKDNGYSKIALNFANEHHAGGGPGIHLDPKTNKLVYDGPSAKAQEESLCQHSNLMASLTQLEHHLVKDGNGSHMIRSYYKEPFDSRAMAYVSQNHLFAVRGDSFYQSKYLSSPVPVSFVTSAAPILSGKKIKPDDQYIVDVRTRIRTHLMAAAKEAVRLIEENPSKPVELILGAFGCGAFAPLNANDYAEIVAAIYLEELQPFFGIFDHATFAVPTFGDKNPLNPCVRNYLAFKKVF